jgi:hypothetical protein
VLKRNTALTVSPIEQMYFLNRTNGLGDPVTSAIIAIGGKVLSAFKSLFGGGGDPSKDIHIPAQEAATNGFAQVLNALSAKQANGSLSVTDIQQGYQTIATIDANFKSLTDALSNQHPEYAPRYRAGYADIHNLEQQLLQGMTPQHYGLSTSSGVFNSVTSAFTNPQGGLSTTGIAVLAAAIFFLPKMMKRG